LIHFCSTSSFAIGRDKVLARCRCLPLDS